MTDPKIITQGVIRIMHFVKVSDELVEHAAVAVEKDGNVTITAAHYKTLMAEAGWRLR
jgi:hypothetical protein